jgi:hypothetical protein
MPGRKLLLFVCLSLADLGLTWHLLAHGEGQVDEGNPLARWWLANCGWPGLTCFKVALAAQSTRTRDLDRHRQQVEIYHRFCERLVADLIARRRTLPEAAALLADFARQHKPEWLGGLGRFYPGRCEHACVVASLVDDTLFRLQAGDPADEETAHRLVSDYRACYGVPPSQQRPPRTAAGDDQLRRAAGEPVRERDVRPREGRLHRRRGGQAGARRSGRGRHPVHRRDRRDGGRPAGQPAGQE